MKKVLCMAAVALLAASCSNNEENIPTPESEINAPAIHISQLVSGISTKAPVTAGKEVTATVVMVDASGSTADWTKFNPVTTNTVNASGTFDKDADRATVSAAKFTAGTTSEVALAPSLYYAVETAANHSHIAAVSPKGTIKAQTVEMVSLDGEQDVMYAKSTDAGIGTTPTTGLNLTFEHVTTQLIFKAKLTAATSNGAWNKKASVKSITIQAAQMPKAVDFSDGSVTWTNPANLLVPNVSSVTIGVGTPSVVGNQVMIQASAEVVVNVVITGGDGKDYDYNNVVIMNDASKLTTVAGKSHEIELTVTEPSKADASVPEITTTATVKEWTPGDSGSGELK